MITRKQANDLAFSAPQEELAKAYEWIEAAAKRHATFTTFASAHASAIVAHLRSEHGGGFDARVQEIQQTDMKYETYGTEGVWVSWE